MSSKTILTKKMLKKSSVAVAATMLALMSGVSVVSATSLDITSGTDHPNKFVTSDGKLTTTIGFDN